MLLEFSDDNYYIKFRNLECQIWYCRITKKHITLPIKKEHPEYHLLPFYHQKIQDISRIINKYIF